MYEHSTYSSRDFLEKLARHAPFPIREVQTDNGGESTNRLIVTKSKHLTLFEEALLYHAGSVKVRQCFLRKSPPFP